MSQLIVAALAVMFVAAVIVAITSLQQRPETPRQDDQLGKKARAFSDRYRQSMTRRTAIIAAIGLVVGVVFFAITGLVALLIATPVAALGVPVLMSNPEADRSIMRLEAMEEWTRNLASVLTSGVGLEGAITTTSRSAPEVIASEIAVLNARLRAQWSIEDALRAFADDLNDATGDTIAATLILAAERRGTGLAKVLTGLAETVADDVSNRREVEADRAKPRTTSRWLTLISLGMLTALLITGTYVEPYKTPVGQLLLLVLLGLYGLCLIWMRRATVSKPLPRFIHRRDRAGARV